MAKTTTKKQPNNFFKFIKWFWILFASGVALFALFFLSASWGAFGPLPEYQYLENPQTNLATEILSSDDITLGKFYLDDNRTPVPFDSLPKNLVNALIASEDNRYYDHAGIDWYGTARAVAYLGKRGGASTISQQLSKLLFTERASSNPISRIVQKAKEWIIATRLERQYTKEEIIAMYLNQYDFGYAADGIRSASKIYFGKEPQQLKVEESAMLVGMLQNSSLYNPIRREELTKKKRDIVISQLARYDFVTENEKDSLQSLKMDVNFNPESHKEGLATYFRMYLQRFMNGWIEKNPKPAMEGERDKWNFVFRWIKKSIRPSILECSRMPKMLLVHIWPIFKRSFLIKILPSATRPLRSWM